MSKPGTVTESVEIIMIVSAICTLIASLAWTLLSENPLPFVIGYPVSAGMGLVAFILNKQTNHENKNSKRQSNKDQ